MSSPNYPVVVFIVAPPDKAESIAESVVREKLAACINVVPSIKSFYWWKGELERDQEALLIVKTQSNLVPAMVDFVRVIHPYENFELISVNIDDGSEPYLEWIVASTRKA